MDRPPIIGGNWATTEPKYRKPQILRSRGRLWKLTATELDILDALSLVDGASNVFFLHDMVKHTQKVDTTQKLLKRLYSFGCVDRVEHFRGKHRRLEHEYSITEYGISILNECLFRLIEDMESKGGK
jgi:predicted transcriptional regulator